VNQDAARQVSGGQHLFLAVPFSYPLASRCMRRFTHLGELRCIRVTEAVPGDQEQPEGFARWSQNTAK
jgi:hypothetical protein